ncbi:MAG: LysR family transcriptional regulator [Hyphomicrobiales bacterium]|nr:LysR family transcriptional regulator [Hyphomicrobiales bacterium]MDE2113779.1 LysR family transcriptional regulator [Hyphomicrobiales bacterium]
MSQPPNSTSWDDFRLVKAIAETRSLTGAAERLDLNHSTVFRRLGQLESNLSTHLFERARSGYVVTKAGAEMVELAQRMAEEIDAFERKAAGRDEKPSGDLRVTVVDTLLIYALTPVFAEFGRQFPEIRLEVIETAESLNLSRRDADIAIRATASPPETLIGRKLGDIVWSRYVPSDPNFVVNETTTRWVGYGGNMVGLLPARIVEAESGGNRIYYRLNTLLGQAEAIAAGIGMGVLPCFIGDQTKGIRRYGTPIQENGGQIWLLTHPDLRHAARVRAFMDFVGSEMTRIRKTFGGEIGVES